MIHYTHGNWRIDPDSCNIERIVCDTNDGCTAVVAGIHHQTLQKGIKPLGCGSGSLAERTANAQLLLNAPDMLNAALELRNTLRALTNALKKVKDAEEPLDRVETVYNLLEMTCNKHFLFEIAAYLQNLDKEKDVPLVPIIQHRHRLINPETLKQ